MSHLAFCDRWLASWTGNRPDELMKFYSDDAFYSDPARPQGLTGRAALLGYFTKLLGKNPNWEWKRVDLFPTERGFTLKWKARIPVGEKVVECFGMDLVELQGDRITRNEVYFDASVFNS